MNTNQGKAEQHTNSLSAKALEYYRMYSGNDELPKYFCGTYDLTSQPSTSHRLANIPNIPEIIVEDCEAPPESPTSSITSTKKLEWDSGADIGYANNDPNTSLQKSTSMPLLRQHDNKSKNESSKLIETGDIDESKSRRKDLMMFLRQKVGNPAAESTPFEQDLKKADSDPEIYVSQTPRKNISVPQRNLNTTTFSYELQPSHSDYTCHNLYTEAADGNGDSDHNTSSSKLETQPVVIDHITSSSALSIIPTSRSSPSHQTLFDDTLPDKTRYFNRYRLKKIESLQISEPISIECIAAPQKSDCDAETQTTMFVDKANSTSVAIQTSRRSSHQEIVYLFHPSIQCDDKTTSSSSGHSVSHCINDQVFSNCNSFEYVSGKDNEVDARKSSSSTLQSINSKDSSIGAVELKIEKSLKVMQKLIKSKKYDDGIKELYIRKIANELAKTSSNYKESEISSESEKIVPQFDRNTKNAKRATTDWPASQTISSSTKVITSDLSENTKNFKDWRNSQNETHSEKLYSSVDSTDSPKEILINFAKRERETQLNWINNEIEHLAKLKSLLETKKESKILKSSTTTTVPKIPNYRKSTAVYMISTEKNDACGDCAETCRSKTKTSANGQIDFHVHNNFGVRDYQFKEIITKITPNHITHTHEVPTATHPYSKLNINNHQIYVSDPNTNYMRNTSRPCRCCPQYPEPNPPAYCHVPSHYQRDIFPVPTVEASPRSRSSSPKSTSITDDTSGYPSRRKTAGRPQTAPASKKQKEKIKTKRNAQVKDSITTDVDSTPKVDFKIAALAQLRKTGLAHENTQESVKTISEESVSHYESLSKYHSKSLSSKGSNQARPQIMPLNAGVLGNNNKTSCLRGSSNYYCAARELCAEGCPASKTNQNVNENLTPEGPPKSANGNRIQSAHDQPDLPEPRPPRKSDEIRSYKDYKASKLKEHDKKRMSTVDSDVPSIERFTNTEGAWNSNDEDDYVDCNAPAFSSKGMCACPKAARKKCQCKISSTDEVGLQATEKIPEFLEKGMKTDEPIRNVDGKEIQVTEPKPEMKQMGVGDEVRKLLSLSPAAVVTYTPSTGDSGATATTGKKSYKMVKDLSKINLSSAVVISSVVTTSVANPEDNIRRLVLEMPLDKKDEDGKVKKTDVAADNRDSNTLFSSAVNSICSCSESTASTRLTTTAGSTSEVMCSCCGKCIPSSNSSLMLGDAGPRGGHSGGPFCWPCYHQSTNREWNPQEPYYQQADHMCKCYNKIDENALDKIRDTLRQLAEIDNCQDAPSSAKAQSTSKCDKLICQSCNKKIKRDPQKKPVAYVLKFEPGEVEEETPQRNNQSLQEIRVKVPTSKHKKKKKGSDNDASGTCRTSKDAEARENKNLQDYLSTNRPDFVRSAEERRRCLIELAYMREQRCQKYKQLLALTNGIPPQNPSNSDKKKFRLFTTKEMKLMTAKKYQKLPEVQQKLLENRDKQNKKANRLLADIFNKKLRENVLRGQASLSTSISVINLM